MTHDATVMLFWAITLLTAVLTLLVLLVLFPTGFHARP